MKKSEYLIADVRSFFVGNTGFEPATSAMSMQHSKPTELITLTVTKDKNMLRKSMHQKQLIK